MMSKYRKVYKELADFVQTLSPSSEACKKPDCTEGMTYTNGETSMKF
jgi:hypothetical protein